MKRLLSNLVFICRLLTLVSMLVLMGSVTIQIFSRTFLPTAPIWTEEVTRYALLYLVTFGTGLSLLSGDLVNVDLVLELVSRRWRRLLTALSLFATAIFAAVLIEPGYEYAKVGTFQTSPSLGLSMTWIYYTMVILPGLLCVFALVAGWRVLCTGAVQSGKVDD